MKPFLLRVPLLANESFRVRTNLGKTFYNQWHYHPEIELIYIVQGSGTGFIGDSIENINDGDLLLIGSNLPHMFRSTEEYYAPGSGLVTESLVVHFLPDILHSFVSLPENKAIADLYSRAAVGLSIGGDTKAQVKKLLDVIQYARNTQKFILLLDILQIIASSRDTRPLARSAVKISFNKTDETRLNRIYHYTMNNFRRVISLDEIADIVHMSPHSFCRYFKSRTQKRYSQFLLEVRISEACKLLTHTDYSIAVVSYESGFMNFSNFNRHFKLIMGTTPFEYRKIFLKIK